MSSLTVSPLRNSISATVEVPGSKSYTNRALVLAALTKGAVVLQNPLFSDDTDAMVECLRNLGIRIEAKKNHLIVYGDIHSVEEQRYDLFARDSGTTMRFLLALLCLLPGVKTIQGSTRLNERPIHDLVEGLRALGGQLEYTQEEGRLPLQISSSFLTNSSVRLKGSTSSQFCSALLMISPFLPTPFTLYPTTPLISKPYVDMTIHCMQEWGVSVITQPDGSYLIPSNSCYQKESYTIEGDYSSASYFFAIAALTHSTITVRNLNPLSKQADRKFLALLEKMGSRITYYENSVSVQGKGVLPLTVDMEDCPDQVMTMAVLAAFAKGITHITGVRSLRYKETERVKALKSELGKMGISAEETDNTLTIHGGTPKPAAIDTYNDHRLAMAFAIAGTRLEGIRIRRPEVVNKTFPTFWTTLDDLK